LAFVSPPKFVLQVKGLWTQFSVEIAFDLPKGVVLEAIRVTRGPQIAFIAREELQE
jgi:hypothetical protein